MSESSTTENIDKILGQWRPVIGKDYDGYRNHVVRMATFCNALRDNNDEEKLKIAIAAAFHDIGIWTANTLDYLDPSVVPAAEYLDKNGLGDWKDEIGLMITEHHRLHACPEQPYPLVEVFRQADLVDFSLGMFKCGLPAETVRQVKHEHPNAGFHKNLAKLASRWCLRHPLNPLPMMKW